MHGTGNYLPRSWNSLQTAFGGGFFFCPTHSIFTGSSSKYTIAYIHALRLHAVLNSTAAPCIVSELSVKHGSAHVIAFQQLVAQLEPARSSQLAEIDFLLDSEEHNFLAVPASLTKRVNEDEGWSASPPLLSCQQSRT